MKPQTKKPFGLQIACKIATQALKEGKAPSSTILYNLFKLQKEEFFPKELNDSYFLKPVQSNNDLEKRIVTKLLDDFKKPNVNIEEVLNNLLEKDWTRKKATPAPVVAPIKKIKRPVVKKSTPKVEPTIIIKKSRI